MLRPSNGPRANEFRMFSSSCLALPCAECTQGSPDPSVDRCKPTTALYGMPGGPCLHSVKSKARLADEIKMFLNHRTILSDIKCLFVRAAIIFNFSIFNFLNTVAPSLDQQLLFRGPWQRLKTK